MAGLVRLVNRTTDSGRVRSASLHALVHSRASSPWHEALKAWLVVTAGVSLETPQLQFSSILVYLSKEGGVSPPPVDEELLEELPLLLELLLLELLEVLLLDDGVHAENKPLLAVRVGAFWSYSIMQIR
jgi:hypothetical protein